MNIPLKAALCSFLLICLGTKSLAQNNEMKILIKDCMTGKPLSDVVVVSDNEQILGNTDNNGICIFKPFNDFVYIKHIGYTDTAFSLRGNDIIVCLKQLANNLDEVKKTEKKINPAEYLSELKKSNLNDFIQSDSNLYYSFENTVSVPDSNWKEITTGAFEFQNRGYTDNHYPECYYTSFNYYIDTAFATSSFYKKITWSKIRDLLNADWVKKNVYEFRATGNLINMRADSLGLVFSYQFATSIYGSIHPLIARFYFNNDKKIDSVVRYNNAEFVPKRNINRQLTYGRTKELKIVYVYTTTYPRVVSEIKSDFIFERDDIRAIVHTRIKLLSQTPVQKMFFPVMDLPNLSNYKRIHNIPLYKNIFK